MTIFDKLVEYPNFAQYLEELPDQTSLMQKKQVLKVDSTFSNSIIKMQEVNTIHMDDKFFKENMGE